MARDAAAPDRSEIAALQQAGVSELFVEAARLEETPTGPRLRPESMVAAPSALPATLVVVGDWRHGATAASRIADDWANSLEAISRDAEGRGWVPVGVHFDLAIAAPFDDSAKQLAAVLGRLRGRLQRRLYLSTTLPRGELRSDGALRLARAADFVVAFLYGQAPDEVEQSASWDLDRAIAQRKELEALGRPYLIGGWSRSVARRRSRDGSVVDHSWALSLARLARSPELSPRPGSVLEGIDHQVWEFEASAPTQAGPWRLAVGESVRVVGPASANVEEFLTRLAEVAGQRDAGFVVRGLPPADDLLSLSPAALASVLEPGVAEPSLRVVVDRMPEPTRGQVRLRVRVWNETEEATDLATLNANFVELRMPGVVILGVDLGDFARWEQLWHGTEIHSVRALREADTLRLYLPLLAGREKVSSGAVTIRWLGRGSPKIETGSTFLFPGGRVWNSPPEEWTFGNMD